jgi:hypothetical protein
MLYSKNSNFGERLSLSPSIHIVVMGRAKSQNGIMGENLHAREDSMKGANVSKCANPQCEQKFKRLGEGKLYVRPAEKSNSGITQKALWLCSGCAETFDLRYDRRKEEYRLVRLKKAA